MILINKDLVFTGGGGRFNAYYSFFAYQKDNSLVHNNNNKITGVGTGSIAAVLFASGAGLAEFGKTALNLNQSFQKDFNRIKNEPYRFQPGMYTDAGFDVRNYWEIPILHQILFKISEYVFVFLLPKLKTEDTANPFRYMKSPMDVYKSLYLLLFDYGIMPLFDFRQYIDKLLKELARAKAPKHHFTDRGLTFKEHCEIFQTDLRIVANLANKGEELEFCSENTPNVAVADALRAGMATPFVFAPTLGFVHRENLNDPFLRIDHFLKQYLESFRGLFNSTAGMTGRLRGVEERLADAILQMVREKRSDSPFRQDKYRANTDLSDQEVAKLNGVINEGNMITNFPMDGLVNPTMVLDINSLSSSAREVKDFASFFRNIFNAVRYNTTLIYSQGSEAQLVKLDVDQFTEFEYSYSYQSLQDNYTNRNKKILNEAFQNLNKPIKK